MKGWVWTFGSRIRSLAQVKFFMSVFFPTGGGGEVTARLASLRNDFYLGSWPLYKGQHRHWSGAVLVVVVNFSRLSVCVGREQAKLTSSLLVESWVSKASLAKLIIALIIFGICREPQLPAQSHTSFVESLRRSYLTLGKKVTILMSHMTATLAFVPADSV